MCYKPTQGSPPGPASHVVRKCAEWAGVGEPTLTLPLKHFLGTCWCWAGAVRECAGRKMLSTRAAEGEAAIRTQAPGACWAHWASGRPDVGSSFPQDPRSRPGMCLPGVCQELRRRLSRHTPDLHLTHMGLRLPFAGNFQVKMLSEACLILIFLFCSFSIHPHSLVGLERRMR